MTQETNPDYTLHFSPPPEQDVLEAKYTKDYQPPLTDPRQAETFRRSLILCCLQQPTEMLRINEAGDPTSFKTAERQANKIWGLRIYLERAVTVLWSMDMWQTASRGSEVFRDQPIDPSLVNPPVQLWIPDRGMRIGLVAQEALGTQGRSELLGALVIEDQIAQSKGVLVTVPFFVHDASAPDYEDKLKAHPLAWVPYFRMMTAELGKPPAAMWQEDYVAMLNFMKLSVVEVMQYKALRPERRRAEKAGHKLPDIRVVQLRKTYRSAAIDEHGEAQPEREFSCHFLVGAHWRNQWYPSSQTHKPKFVAPYIKGALDKPFKAPSKTIYSVVR
jgi:hypothetical protein